ncbi:hypothetical protein MSSIH_1342 [Methanosarcina siciliae HI350]|uniref:Phage protein n=1 Tax=Methanosarcina siciliae HI350 TaxID=1434119 RepID=A0A0E3PD32_9EURY|nr:hypothetical protein [Methanosarcina siciliae]AKB32032.1 hypothetical protein MSSIH_1342 [Methanosarcina siciliae HI350]
MYSDLEAKLVEDFKAQSGFRQEGPDDENLEFKEEIYWVFKYLKIIQFIQDGPDGLISVSSKGMEFLNSQLPGESKLEEIEQLVEIRYYFDSFELELDPIVVSYKQLTEFADKGKVDRTLSSFYCTKDPDIQDFVRCNMERFDDKSTCRSYLILDRMNSDDENFCVLGFFALALKILRVEQSKLNRKQKKDMNLLREQEGIPSYFIAQLGKNDMFKYNFEGKYLLDEAINIVYDCIGLLGGTIVWLEANKEADSVVKYYKDNGFIELQSELQEDGVERMQLVKYLNRE